MSSTGADQFQRDTERAKALSRDVNPLSLADLLSKGVAFAAWNLGILCRRPEIFIELDGNCIWISVCHAMDPTLRGADLQQAAWELRVKALGTVPTDRQTDTDRETGRHSLRGIYPKHWNGFLA